MFFIRSLCASYLRLIICACRDTDEIEQRSEKFRCSLLEKVKNKVNPSTDRFRAEVAALNKYKATLKQEGLLEAFVVLASEKGLKVRGGRFARTTRKVAFVTGRLRMSGPC